MLLPWLRRSRLLLLTASLRCCWWWSSADTVGLPAEDARLLGLHVLLASSVTLAPLMAAARCAPSATCWLRASCLPCTSFRLATISACAHSTATQAMLEASCNYLPIMCNTHTLVRHHPVHAVCKTAIFLGRTTRA
jgi:hypothetical protein